MKMLNSRVFVYLAAIAGACFSDVLSVSLHAQSGSRPAVPNGLLLKAAPAFSEWEITFTYPQDLPDAIAAQRKDSLYQRGPRRSVVTKTQNILREVILRVNGEKVERWQIDRTVYIFAPQAGFWAMYGPEFHRNNRDGDSEKLPLPESGFSGLNWISAETFAGNLSENGREFLIFVPVDSGPIDLSDVKALKNLSTIAFVDAYTRLPVSVRENGIQKAFVFRNAPSQKLSPPADLATDLKRAAEIEAKSNIAPGREY